MRRTCRSSSSLGDPTGGRCVPHVAGALGGKQACAGEPRTRRSFPCARPDPCSACTPPTFAGQQRLCVPAHHPPHTGPQVRLSAGLMEGLRCLMERRGGGLAPPMGGHPPTYPAPHCTSPTAPPPPGGQRLQGGDVRAGEPRLRLGRAWAAGCVSGVSGCLALGPAAAVLYSPPLCFSLLHGCIRWSSNRWRTRTRRCVGGLGGSGPTQTCWQSQSLSRPTAARPTSAIASWVCARMTTAGGQGHFCGAGALEARLHLCVLQPGGWVGGWAGQTGHLWNRALQRWLRLRLWLLAPQSRAACLNHCRPRICRPAPPQLRRVAHTLRAVVQAIQPALAGGSGGRCRSLPG